MKQSKLKEKVNEVYLPMYGHSIYTVISTDLIKSRKKRYKILGHDNDLDGYTGLFSSNGGHDGFIFLGPDADAEVIAHEAFHAVCYIMNHIGTILCDESEECFAYPLGYLVGSITKFIKSNKKYFKDHAKSKSSVSKQK